VEVGQLQAKCHIPSMAGIQRVATSERPSSEISFFHDNMQHFCAGCASKSPVDSSLFNIDHYLDAGRLVLHAGTTMRSKPLTSLCTVPYLIPHFVSSC